MVNRDKFFNIVRYHPFPGHMVQTQVDGTDVLLNTWEYIGGADLRWLAYSLATPYHETAHTMQPIHELGERSYFDKYEPGTDIGAELGNTEPGDGYLYRGRGYAQLTGRANYKKLGEILEVDLVNKPELALDPDTAAMIMFEGMVKGLFTGKKLSDFFNDDKTDWTNARRIINRLDRATLIAGYAKDFYAALTKAT